MHKKPQKYYKESDQNLRFNVFSKSGLRFSLDFKYSIVSFYEKIYYKSFLVFFFIKRSANLLRHIFVISSSFLALKIFSPIYIAIIATTMLKLLKSTFVQTLVGNPGTFQTHAHTNTLMHK